MTIAEVADYLSISAATIRNKDFRKKCGLNIIRIGRSIRFKREEIEDFVSRNIEYVHAESDGNQ